VNDCDTHSELIKPN